MPWTYRDALSHTKKAVTRAKQRAWARIASAVLRKTGDDGRAIREANAAVGRMK